MRVADNGVGLDPSDVAGRAGHLGLIAMRERAEAAGGRLEIGPAPNSGTAVEFYVPVQPARGDGE